MVFQGIEKSLQGSPTAPIFGVQTVLLVTVLAARESDPLAGSQSTLGTSDCQGVLSACFKNRKTFVPFELKACIAANLFERILHRSGRTRFSSQFRGPKSLLRS